MAKPQKCLLLLLLLLLFLLLLPLLLILLVYCIVDPSVSIESVGFSELHYILLGVVSSQSGVAVAAVS